jgi:hypothetical protein
VAKRDAGELAKRIPVFHEPGIDMSDFCALVWVGPPVPSGRSRNLIIPALKGTSTASQ